MNETTDSIVEQAYEKLKAMSVGYSLKPGERLNEGDLVEIYGAIATACRRFRGWRGGFLVGSPLFEEVMTQALGRPRIKKPLANANLRAYFFLYNL